MWILIYSVLSYKSGLSRGTIYVKGRGDYKAWPNDSLFDAHFVVYFILCLKCFLGLSTNKLRHGWVFCQPTFFPDNYFC